MTLLALGINHRTAAVDVREKIAFSPVELNDALIDMTAIPGVRGSVVLSTCNRTELYCALETAGDEQAVVEWFSRYHGVSIEEIRACSYCHTGPEAARHLMRVACGLDSMVLGEPQILGQLKDAYQKAQYQKTVKGELDRLFQHTFSVAKQVRTDTGIGENPVSVAFAAVNLASRIFDDFSRSRALLIGAGETIELVARHLREAGIQGIIVANRTQERAQTLADEVGGAAIGLEEIPSALTCADIVISSTASPLPILGKGMVEAALKTRRFRPMFMVDIAVPRDIETQVGELDDVFLYTVDDLHDVIEENRRQRQAAADQAELIITAGIDAWQHERRIRGGGQVIRQYRQQAERLRRDAEAQALAQLAQGQSAEEVIRRLTHQLNNRLLHGTTRRLREASGAERLDLLQAAEELLLDPSEAEQDPS
ncbi:glutamyl-tRNA reductase [Larsenimonas rhizosphaerae]|uniref:Glutamyl-tRNA reductase n=1 Tax=Larsenimonas rhizosphaerae TaxID=2944682 RepID=A0AA41ZEK1_9GAMM|nr:glutamyl-tRNA reductase [Larsenimonas rhizosphaerae]MCM2131119.1 glutamyl-tRNA reductase [Larsenimonas rhizosphaerae]MCX2523824.1 glutamyl-tRNA reductase [Larsenimonas rhizosphaerae]